MRARIVIMGLMALAACACRESRTDNVIVQEPNEADSSAPPSSSCVLTNGACGPPEACCPDRLHVIGMRVDLERACHVPTREILFCRTQTEAGACGADDAHDCWTKRLADGGVDVYFTPQTWRAEDLPGFEHCDPDLYMSVAVNDRRCD